MKKIASLFIIMFTLVPLFQNCSSEHAGLNGEDSFFSLSSLYPYEDSPVYFDDVQIVGKSLDSGVWNYQFVASIVDIDDEDKKLDVELIVYKSNDQLVCPRVTGTVSRGSNHIEISNCKTSEDLNLLKVEVRAAVKGKALESIRIHKFEL